ncbi:MAG: DUF481 domain-containing protein [Gammaproteobacteria bacterium]|nr:DUF481 domain-containing protein [Gammaproteobacteria bacterium]MDH3749629.1 DUF481 domain-containing protein [Gammaproteobacteria bacterium]
MTRTTAALIAALMGISMPVIAADKTDILTFINGDHLTGEVKSLERGRLRFNTDATGTISIEWDDVAFLKSDQNIQVETENGVRYLGHLSASTDEKQIIVETGSGPVGLETDRVILMTPIEERGLDRLDGDISAGYNLAKADNVTSTHLAIDLNHRTEARILSLEFDSLLTDSSTNEPSQDISLDLDWTRLLANRWLAGGFISFDRNDELGLDLRTTIGAGGGRILRQSNNSALSLIGGLQVSREDVGADVSDENFLEAFATLQWDWFQYDTPELDLTTSLQIIPNLTDSGEYRGEFKIEVKWEIIEDLFWSLTINDSYDSKAELTGGEKNDYSIITSLGWDF